jgi:hypothetical protein
VGYSALGMPHLSLQYYLVPIAATRLGVSYDPTGDTVEFAFMPTPTQVPGNTDWVSGSWDTSSASVLYPYSAKCLIGPGGTITLGIGTYISYVKVTDSPEIPVFVVGQLAIS